MYRSTKYDVGLSKLGGNWQLLTQMQFDERILECEEEWSGTDRAVRTVMK